MSTFTHRLTEPPAQALAERITQWLDRGVSSEIRRACRAYCVSKFSVERVIPALEDVFSETMKNKGRGK